MPYLRFHSAFLKHVLMSGWNESGDGFCIMKRYWLKCNLWLYISKSQNSTRFWVSISSMWCSASYPWILERKRLGWPSRSSKFLTKLSRKINLGTESINLSKWTCLRRLGKTLEMPLNYCNLLLHLKKIMWFRSKDKVSQEEKWHLSW